MTERKVFYVDVGDMSAKEAEEVINKFTNREKSITGFWASLFGLAGSWYG